MERQALAAVLRARRAELGLSIEQLAQETRIPAEQLLALEEGRDTDLPDAPWRDGFIRTYRRRLGLEEDGYAPTPPPRPPRHRVPLWGVRLIATGMAFLLLVAVAWRLGPRVFELALRETELKPPAVDQEVKLTLVQRVRVRVLADGESVLDRVVDRGEALRFSAHDRIEVDLPAASAARVTYNGRTIVPQGRQDEPRRLVFIDDSGQR